MRILVLNQYFHPDGASSGQLLTELCEDLARRHDVWVVTGHPSYNVPGEPLKLRGLLSRQSHGSVNVIRVWSTSFPRAGMAGRILNYLTYLSMSIAGAFAAPRPDVVMTWTDPPPIGLVGDAIARLRKVPFLFSSQDIVPEAAVIAGGLSNPIMIRLLRSVTNRILRDAARVVSIGRDMNKRLIARGVADSRIVLITNWMDGGLVKPLDKPSAYRSARGWNDLFVVMHSGNLGFSQDLDTLIDAAVLLRDEPGILIAIVGEGTNKQRLERKARRRGLDNVSFLPFEPKSELGSLLGAADIHIVSHKHGLPGYQVPSKFYGILAAGKPVVAAVDEGCEVALVVEESDCGKRVSPGDASVLAGAISELRKDDLAGMGKRARAVFEARFTRAKSTASYQQVLEELAGGGTGAQASL